MELPNVNYLQLIMLFMTFTILILGSMINYLENYIPVFVSQTFRYGKFAYKGKPSKLKVIEVPKSWFKHFYVFASIYCVCALYFAIDVYLYDAKPPKWLLSYLDFLCGSTRSTDCKQYYSIFLKNLTKIAN